MAVREFGDREDGEGEEGGDEGVDRGEGEVGGVVGEAPGAAGIHGGDGFDGPEDGEDDGGDEVAALAESFGEDWELYDGRQGEVWRTEISLPARSSP